MRRVSVAASRDGSGVVFLPTVSSAAIVPAKTPTYRKRRSDVSEMDSVSSTYRLPRGQPLDDSAIGYISRTESLGGLLKGARGPRRADAKVTARLV